MCVRVCLSSDMFIYIYIYSFIHIYICALFNIYICKMHACVYIHIYIYMHMCVSVNSVFFYVASTVMVTERDVSRVWICFVIGIWCSRCYFVVGLAWLGTSKLRWQWVNPFTKKIYRYMQMLQENLLIYYWMKGLQPHLTLPTMWPWPGILRLRGIGTPPQVSKCKMWTPPSHGFQGKFAGHHGFLSQSYGDVLRSFK